MAALPLNYRAYLAQLNRQRLTSKQQADAAAKYANQMGDRVRQQGASALQAANSAGNPEPQRMMYGGNYYSSSLAQRPPIRTTLKDYPKYPSQYPSPPKYTDEPIGSWEKQNAQGFNVYLNQALETMSAGYKDPYRGLPQGVVAEIQNKVKWWETIEPSNRQYEERVKQYNQQVSAYQEGVKQYQTSLSSFNSEMQARSEAASRPVIPLVSTGEAATQRPNDRRRGTGRGTLLAGNTGGYNPATGGSGGLGSRSLLG